jgi:hypothetical protein
MKQGSIRKPAGWLAIVGLAAAGALSLFAFSSSGSAYAAGIDDQQNLSPTVFNQPGGDDDCDNDHNGGYGGWNQDGQNHNNDDCDHNNDHGNNDCDHDNNWWQQNNRGRDRDRECGRDDRDNHDRDDCDRDRDSRDRDRDRDDCDRDRDNHDDCDDDHRDRDHRNNDDCEATITIVKQITGSGDGSARFRGDLGSFTLGDGDSESFRVDPGTYVVWETDTTDLESIRCTGDGFASTDRPNGKVTIRVHEDDDVTCTFTNEGVEKVKAVSPAVAPQPQIIYVPVPAPQPVTRPVEVVREPAPAPRPTQTVAALPRTGEGLDFQREGSLALPLGVLAALSVAGFGYVAARRVRDTD